MFNIFCTKGSRTQFLQTFLTDNQIVAAMNSFKLVSTILGDRPIKDNRTQPAVNQQSSTRNPNNGTLRIDANCLLGV